MKNVFNNYWGSSASVFAQSDIDNSANSNSIARWNSANQITDSEVLLNDDGGITALDSITFLQNAVNPGDTNTLWVDSATGHINRGTVDLEDNINGPATTTLNEITVYDASGHLINSNILISSIPTIEVLDTTITLLANGGPGADDITIDLKGYKLNNMFCCLMFDGNVQGRGAGIGYFAYSGPVIPVSWTPASEAQTVFACIVADGEYDSDIVSAIQLTTGKLLYLYRELPPGVNTFPETLSGFPQLVLNYFI